MGYDPRPYTSTPYVALRTWRLRWLTDSLSQARNLCFDHDHADCSRNRRALGSVEQPVADEHLLVILFAEALVMCEFLRWFDFR